MREVAQTENGARRRAVAALPRFAGAVAFVLTTDEKTGKRLTSKILETYGDVPDDFADRLPGG